MVLRLARLFVAPGLLVAGLISQPSAEAGMITNQKPTEGGSALAGATYENFDGLTLGSVNQTTSTGLAVAFTNGAAVVTGSAASMYNPPNFSGDNNKYFYTTNPPSSGPDQTYYLSTGQGTVTFSKAGGGSLGTYFGLLWGSADSFNSLTFSFADGTPDVTVTGDQLGFPFGGPTTYYVNFFASSALSKVSLTSVIPSFEFDNVAFGNVSPSSVPEPASLAMVGVGLIGVGFYARKRRA